MGVVTKPVIFGGSYRDTWNKLWEAFILKWFLTAVVLFIVVGIVTAYLTVFSTRARCAPATVKTTNLKDITAQISGLNMHELADEKIEDKLLLSEIVNSAQSCEAAVVPVGQQGETQPMKLVCYYTFPSASGLEPKDIDPFLCTHINIASVGILNNKLEPLSEERQQLIKSVVGLKIHNKNLKVLLCVGGEPGGFAVMVSKLSSRRMFIKNLLSFLLHYSFDGVDFDWEFPGWPGKITQRRKFTIFLKELHSDILKNGLDLIVSVAVAAPKSIVDVSYDVSEMNSYIDYVNLMAYDFHLYTWYLPMTGSNAPLYSHPDDKGYLSTLNTNWSAVYWHQKGMPKNKIVVGIPTYGHSFRLVNANNHGWSAPASGVGQTGMNGFVSYPDVCQFLHTKGSTYKFDENLKVPYAYMGLEWLSYDDVCSVAYKAKYIISSAFGGAMVFSINEDDHHGLCSGTKFLLITQIKSILGMY